MQELVQQDELVLALVTDAHGGPGGDREAQLAEQGQSLAAEGGEVGVLVAPRPAAVLAGHDSLRLLADIGQPGLQLGERRGELQTRLPYIGKESEAVMPGKNGGRLL